MECDLKIAVVGGGVEGLSVARHLLKHGYTDLTFCDVKESLDNVPEGVKLRPGSRYLDSIGDFDAVFRSPGVKLSDLKEAKKITSSTKYFFENCPCPVIGVSGTKGKGTCASLIEAILGPDVKLGGNIGNPPLDFIDDLKPDSLVILELSSFQLQDLTQSPHIAVLLNTTTDHLDYHADEAEYQVAKGSLLKYQKRKDYAILNQDYPYFKEYRAQGKLLTVSLKEMPADGAYVKDGLICFNDEELMRASEVGLIGKHNLENVLPAICVAKILGIQTPQIVTAVRDFTGLPHRIEFVRDVSGVKYYNDSCSTNPETSIACVKAFEEPLILIAGGSNKGADFAKWGVELSNSQNLQTVILIGETADKLELALFEAGFEGKIVRRGDIEQAILEAYTLAEKGDVVALSPGCASFDQFNDYKERGIKFKDEVWRLRPY